MSHDGLADGGAKPERYGALMRLAAGATIALVLFAIIDFLRGPEATVHALR